MNAREERFARNETLFREVNERIEDVSRGYEVGDDLEVLCECGRSDCLATLAVRGREYEAVRAEPELFLVAPGHAAEEVEVVVERRKAYVIVRKVGEAGEIAAASDPRS